MSNSRAKAEERELLDLVFGPDRPWEIEASERPDFLFKHHGETFHGAEVTRFFPSEAEARLKNYPGYASRILGGGGHHKGDEQLLPVVTIAFQKSKTAQKAMWHGRPTPQECIDRFGERLREKNEKCPAYLESAPQVDLIVGDPCEYMPLKELREMLSLMLLGSVRDQLTRSGFREIFLTTRHPRSMYFPLKANLLSMEAVTFERRLKAALEQGWVEATGPAPFVALIQHLADAGLGEAIVWTSPSPSLSELRVAFGVLELRYTERGRQRIRVRTQPGQTPGEAQGWRSIRSLVAEFDQEDEDLAKTALGAAVETWTSIPLLFEGGTGDCLSQPTEAFERHGT